MSDPYREASQTCPTCRVALREFRQRWVCDACSGMLLAVDDLESTLVGVGALGVRVEATEATARACPRCDARLHACAITTDGEQLDQPILYCRRDGLWLEGGVLEELLFHFSRKHPGGGGTGYAYGGGEWSASRTWWDKPRPLVRTPFATALAGHLPCPVCTSSLELRGRLWACDEHGVLVEHLALAEMMTEMTHQPWQPPESTGTPGKRECPACAGAMVMEVLDGVPVDYCRVHGIWFDPGELEATLAHASGPPTSWFRRLFG